MITNVPSFCCLTTREGLDQVQNAQTSEETSAQPKKHTKADSSMSTCTVTWTSTYHGHSSAYRNQNFNCVCNRLTKQAVTTAIIKGYHNGPAQILPREELHSLYGEMRLQATFWVLYDSMPVSQLPANTLCTSRRKTNERMTSLKKMTESITIWP